MWLWIPGSRLSARPGMTAVKNRRTMVASIGPTTSEELREQGIRIDMEPSHPKMGFLVREAAEHAASTASS